MSVLGASFLKYASSYLVCLRRYSSIRSCVCTSSGTSQSVRFWRTDVILQRLIDIRTLNTYRTSPHCDVRGKHLHSASDGRPLWFPSREPGPLLVRCPLAIILYYD